MINRNKLEKGLVSVIILTFNRGHLVDRSIESMLQQTYPKVDIILVDNGSTDDTPKLLSKYQAPEYAGRIRHFRLPENRLFTGGTNFALDQIKGEWFTMLDDDDEAVPYALETMMRIPLEVDKTVNAVTCNCIDTATGTFSGTGPTEDLYLPTGDTVALCEGEFWGITKTELLGADRLNEKLVGYENTLWYKINQRANRYYIHQALRIWHTDHGDTMTFQAKRRNIPFRANVYRQLLNEDFYWHCLRSYVPRRYRDKCFKGMVYLIMDGDLIIARKYFDLLIGTKPPVFKRILAQLAFRIPPSLLRMFLRFIPESLERRSGIIF